MIQKLLKISIIGKTNAGKSTLINNFVGEIISITNKKINTTEDLIIGIAIFKNIQLVFYDTPGLNNIKSINKKNIKMKQNLWNGLNETDLILYLIDITKYDFNEISSNINKLEEIKKPIIIVFNKNDLIEKKLILPKINELNKKFKLQNFFSISAKKILGLDVLKEYLQNKSYQSQWIYEKNEITNKDDIFITNECTRDVILNLIHKEIPYNIKITNKLFKFLKNGDLKIKQNIEIENQRYKKIILGKNGDKIKDIRIKSQSNISKILKTKVHLYIKIIKANAEKI
tara:strand:+ start:1928 stop:2785 length:858 start_codon:yes stop_codon:yes gene_type:complete